MKIKRRHCENRPSATPCLMLDHPQYLWAHCADEFRTRITSAGFQVQKLSLADAFG
ncbi:hypothetical protein SAMN05444000_10295 [Shimia gijangensis]|uniref:Uncharacterized protein n=1 Tax=Shimia gijangensis TaxID=1470563 RepID=A0A1M6CLQ5_9RHOB|nr:hypothetical protein SAMN05444000_10295 [Shimia gijangensis]